MADIPVVSKVTSKNVWPIVVLVIVFIVAMWIVSKAKTQTIVLHDNGDGTMEGTINDGWFVKKAIV